MNARNWRRRTISVGDAELLHPHECLLASHRHRKLRCFNADANGWHLQRLGKPQYFLLLLLWGRVCIDRRQHKRLFLAATRSYACLALLQFALCEVSKELLTLVRRQAVNGGMDSSDVRERLWRWSGWLWRRRGNRKRHLRRRGNRKRHLRRRLSSIARDGARVHSLQPYGFADFTALVFIWNHIFLNVSDFSAKGSCFGSAMLGHIERVPIFSCSVTTMVTVTQARFVPRHFCEYLTGK